MWTLVFPQRREILTRAEAPETYTFADRGAEHSHVVSEEPQACEIHRRVYRAWKIRPARREAIYLEHGSILWRVLEEPEHERLALEHLRALIDEAYRGGAPPFRPEPLAPANPRLPVMHVRR